MPTPSYAYDTNGPYKQWEQIQIPTALASSMGAIVPAVTLEGRHNALQKRSVNILNLVDWGWIDIECVCKLWQ